MAKYTQKPKPELVKRNGKLYLSTDGPNALPVCPYCEGEGMHWNYGLNDVLTCQECKGRGRMVKDG